jgi:hypothetical protein
MLAQATDTIRVYSTPATPTSQSHAEKYSVAGTVLDAVTGEPIRKALVQINAQQSRTSFTDGDGRFQFEGIPAGIASLTCQKPGYFDEQAMHTTMATTVQVGPNARPAVVMLTPEAVITGKVTTTAGVPLEHVSISLNYIDIRDGRRHWESKGISNTDEDGRFRFANLLPGTYYVGAGPLTPLTESLFDIDSKPKTGYSSVFYPGVPELASASPIQLNAGQQAETNFSLNEVPVYSVSGTISGYAPNQGVGIQLLNQSGSVLPVGVQFSSENGRFDVKGLPAGSYVLKALSQSAPNQPIRTEASLNVASNIFNLRLTLGPAISIPVSVRTEAGVAAERPPTAISRLSLPGPPLSLRLLASEPGMGDFYSTLEGPPGQQTLQLSNLDPGRYTVEVIPQGSWYVQSAEYGQTNLLTDDLVLTAGAPALPIEVVLRNDGASITGTVTPRNGADVPATVVAIQERGNKATPKIAYYFPRQNTTAGPGEFVITPLAPGDYLVLAFDHADSIEYSNPEVLQNYLSQAAHVTVNASQRATITLDLIRTGETSD